MSADPTTDSTTSNNAAENNNNTATDNQQPTTHKQPFDVKWHHQALQKIAMKNKKLQAESEAAVQNVVGTMKSPLNMGQRPCNAEHEALLKCVTENTSKANASSEVEMNSLFRQNLTIAAMGNSRRHFETVENLSKKLPDKMPSGKIGVMLQPCESLMMSFRKCCEGAAEEWYQVLNDMHSRSQQQ